MIAAKNGPDPSMNFKLRFEIDKAREASMPKENIDRAIAKATTDSEKIEEIIYEGFGPAGISVMVEVASDNKNRTAQEMKNIFDKNGGNLAGPGAVSFNFESKGFMLVKKTADPESEMLSLIDAGVEDVSETEDGIEVYTVPEKLGETHKALSAKGFEISQAEMQMNPKNLQVLEDPVEAAKALKFLDTLEELEDVQKVYTNLEVPENVMKQLDASA